MKHLPTDEATAEQIIQLFSSKKSKHQQPKSLFKLVIECSLVRISSYDYQISLQFKAGEKRLYTIQRLRSFLQAVVLQQSYPLTKSSRYTPELHRFLYGEEQLLLLLASSIENEPEYNNGDTRSIIISPAYWDKVADLLLQCESVELHYYVDYGPLDEQLKHYTGLRFTEDKLPITLKLEELNGRYMLEAAALETAIILSSYSLICIEGTFYKAAYIQVKQLQLLQRLLEEQQFSPIMINEDQISSFMDQVIPKLNKLAEVVISPTISTKILKHPLQAHIYLDLVRERLLVGVEFVYGDLIIHPFAPSTFTSISQIVLREYEQEDLILSKLEIVPSLKTEGGYVIEGDDDHYQFLYHILPSLPRAVTVHATSAIKLRYVKEDIYPQVHLSWDEKSNWLQYQFKIDGISEPEIKAVIQAIQMKKKYYKLSRGALLSLEGKQFSSLIRVMQELGLSHPLAFDEQIPIHQAVSFMGQDTNQSTVTISRSLQRFSQYLSQPSLLNFEVPSSIKPFLRDYQIDGYQWMRLLAQYQLGGILADEMGLGKTIQTIAFITSMLPEIRANKQKVLIVTPASLLFNWQEECYSFSPDIKVSVIEAHGKQHLLQPEYQADADVWITSYPTLRQQPALFHHYQYHTIICDEAQAFKNDYTLTAKSVRAIQAQYRFALTGTPIENRLDELWSIMHFVNPAIFNHKNQFLEWPRQTILARIRPFMLRRLKQEVLQELPEKIETIVTSPLLKEQRKLYLAYLAKLQEDTVKHLDPKQAGQNRIKILAGITRLRQICCHPALFMDNYEGESGKLNQLLEIVEEHISTGRRILIFSQFTTMLHIIRSELTLRGYEYFYIDGQTPPRERVQQCQSFNDGERELVLLSLKAGGTGLNLTGADTVILYDLWWNPAVEQQAADRVHRIGQKKVVQIIKLVAEGTLEDKMISMQQRKQQLIDDILIPDEQEHHAVNNEELIALLRDLQQESLHIDDL